MVEQLVIFDFIMGIHSIEAALKNKSREIIEGFTIEEHKSLVRLSGNKITLCAPHKVQEEAKKYFKKLNLEYVRVPSHSFIIAKKLPSSTLEELISESYQKKIKILCLDQVTDVHNGAAIMRTAAFFGVDYVVVPQNHSFGETPSFFRIASGATEFIKILRVKNLNKAIQQFIQNKIHCLALSEHAKQNFDEFPRSEQSLCLVLGQEETGIAHALLRLIPDHYQLVSHGPIHSLNVSAAATLAMSKCF